MKKERVLNIKLLLGETWEDTARKMEMAREFCNVKDESLIVEILYKDVSKFQLDHLRHGVIPFSSTVANIADMIKFIDEDGSIKVLKSRYEATGEI